PLRMHSLICLQLAIFWARIGFCPKRRLRLSVRTRGSQPRKRGSTPLGATNALNHDLYIIGKPSGPRGRCQMVIHVGGVVQFKKLSRPFEAAGFFRAKLLL